MLDVGSTVAGKFRIERILGAGGMGVVAVATHLQLDQRVALKVLHDRTATDPSAVERFLREARAVAKLRSEHVCRVFDVGQLDNGSPYIVMELLDGRDLAQVIAERQLAPAEAIELVLQACVAIAEAHAHGIVHRDLKPANLFVARRLDGSPLVKVLDFGIAKAPAAADTALTQTNAVLGTPGYMAPEQLRSTRDVDARADIWALGVIIYQAISGRLPFPGASLTEIAVKIAIDPPEPIDVAPELGAALSGCLAKELPHRYRDVGELARAFARFAGPSAHANAALAAQLLGGSGTAPTLAATGTPAPVPTTLQSAAAAVHAPSSPRHTARWLGLGGVALAAAAVAIAVIASGGTDAPVAVPAPTPAPAPAPVAVAVPDAAPVADAAPAAVAVAVPAPAPHTVHHAPPSAAPVPVPVPVPAPVPAPIPASTSADESAFGDAIATHHCERAIRLLSHIGLTAERQREFTECQKGRQYAFAHSYEPDSEAWVLAFVDDLTAAGNAAGARTEHDVFYYARGSWACGHAQPAMARDAYAKQSADSNYRAALVRACQSYNIKLD